MTFNDKSWHRYGVKLKVNEVPDFEVVFYVIENFL